MDDLTAGVSGGDGSATAADTSLATLGSDGSSLSPAGDATNLSTPDTSLESAAPAWESIINSIPDTDDDISQPTFQHVEAVRNQRQQLRVLKSAVKELQPARQQLEQYQQLGELANLNTAAELLAKLYTPLTDRNGNPIIDPETQTSHVTTKPFLEYLDEKSPGMPEQLLVDLLDFQPLDENGELTPRLSNQVMSYWGLNPAFMAQYRAVGTPQAAPSLSVVSAAELEDIPKEFHNAYRSLPPSVRVAWDAYDEADQLVLLTNEQERLHSVDFRNQVKEERERVKQIRQQEYQQLVNQERAKYFDQVRRERFAAIANGLSNTIFSTDAVTNAVMHGAVGTVLANLIDTELRFVGEPILAALNIKLDHTFDEALNAFNVHAGERAAQLLAGDEVRASQSEEKANAAANLLTVKLGTIALAVARAMGGQQATAAATQGQALSNAATSRPNAGNGSAPGGVTPGILPPGIRPGTPEAARYLAEQTGFLRAV